MTFDTVLLLQICWFWATCGLQQKKNRKWQRKTNGQQKTFLCLAINFPVGEKTVLVLYRRPSCFSGMEPSSSGGTIHNQTHLIYLQLYLQAMCFQLEHQQGNILLARKKPKSQPQAASIKNIVKSGHLICEICLWTDKQCNTLLPYQMQRKCYFVLAE